LHVIDNNRRFAVRGISVASLGLLVMVLKFLCVPVSAGDINIPVKNIAQITVDDDGRDLTYPTAVFYDSTEEEIYVVNSTSSRVVVYGPDFFPRTSIGIGRSVGAPRGGLVLPDGQVYISQVRTRKSTVPRITILNGAFFVDQEINLDEIPEAEDFAPRNVAVNREGVIYLAGDNNFGVLVLDKEGTFLRRIQPMDMVTLFGRPEEPAQPAEGEGAQAGSGEALPGEMAEETPAENSSPPGADTAEKVVDIPEEFRPRSSRGGAGPPGRGIGPVKINYVAIDSIGNIYLVSAQTAKIYVYGPDESFLFSFGQKGGSPRQMSTPRSLAIDENRGLIYVADYMRHTILAYNLAGEYLFEFGGRGFGPGWFNFPSGIAVNRHGQVIVADLFNNRVQVLEVEYEKAFPMFGGGLEILSSEEGSDATGPGLSDEHLPESTDEGSEKEIIPDADLPVHGDGWTERQTAPDKSPPGRPDAPVEEVIIPMVEIPGYREAGGEKPSAPPDSTTTQPAAVKDRAVTPEIPQNPPDSGNGGSSIPDRFKPGRPR